MSSRPTRTTVAALAFIGAALLGGCSTFDRDWEATALTAARATEEATEGATEGATERTVEAAGIDGRWRGTRRSDVNGHSGGLRCILTLEESGALHARYHATYGGIFSFSYDVAMTVRQEDDTYHFAGESDLGWLAGGRYEYDGTVVGDAFRATYASKSDHGVFEMTRVAGGDR